ncbi:hypothetical protein [Achromobacter insuavis]|uniref:hypothetical protein n=1 Tax=Achromobacter insuavis TaxID=1287735 RepID=UPI001F072787|nr:hypothetical protein [Achromobacter insuavis]
MDGGSVIGHQTLIAARMAGYRPADVWVACVPAGQRYGSFTHPEAMIGRMTNGRWVGNAEIHICDSENVAALDLRSVVGTVVHLLAPNRARAYQVIRRLAECSPSKVIASGDWGMALWQPGANIEWVQA